MICPTCSWPMVTQFDLPPATHVIVSTCTRPRCTVVVTQDLDDPSPDRKQTNRETA